MSIQLSEALDRDLATLGCNERPEGWREADFDTLIAYVAPECPDILGEIELGFENVLAEDVPVVGLVVRPSEGRSWDFRPFGQSTPANARSEARPACGTSRSTEELDGTNEAEKET